MDFWSWKKLCYMAKMEILQTKTHLSQNSPSDALMKIAYIYSTANNISIFY